MNTYEPLGLKSNPFLSLPLKDYTASFRDLFSARDAQVQRTCSYTGQALASFVIAPYGGGKTVVVRESLARLEEAGYQVVYAIYRRSRGFCRSILKEMIARGFVDDRSTSEELDQILLGIGNMQRGGKNVVLAIDDLDRAKDIDEVKEVTNDVREILGEGSAVIITGQPFGVTFDLNTSAGGIFHKISIPEFSCADFHEMLEKYLRSVHVSKELPATHPFDEQAADFICAEMAVAKLTPRLFNFAVAKLLVLGSENGVTEFSLDTVRKYWPHLAEDIVVALTDLHRQHLELIIEAKDVSEDSMSTITELGGNPLAEYPEVVDEVLRPLLEKNLLLARNDSGKDHYRPTPHAAMAINNIKENNAMPIKTFISYSHDNPAHSARVLDLAQRLLDHGVDVVLDQFETRPPSGWPRWCEEQLRPECADFVLVVCTPTYLDRIEGKVPADEGRGVYWEGSVLNSYLYDEKENRRFIPILLEGHDESSVPRPLKTTTHYRLAAFDLQDAGYRALYRELTAQPAVVKRELGTVVTLGPETSPDIQIRPAVPRREPLTNFSEQIPQTDDRELLERLKGLPSAQFEELVFIFDRGSAIPGRPESQAIRAMELLRLMRSRDGGLDTLAAKIHRIIKN